MIDGTLFSFLIGAITGTTLMALVIIPAVVGQKKRIEELEAKLERVEGLPEKWRDISYKTTDAYTNLHGCADELQSALGDEE